MGSERSAIDEAIAQLREATVAKKCWPCGCLHQSLHAIDQAVPAGDQSAELRSALAFARERLLPVQYECLGCEVCYPALAVNAVSQLAGEAQVEVCPREEVVPRVGWPPLPGSYFVLRYQSSVAVCTLTDDALSTLISHERWPDVSIVGTMQTENLGIERLIQNVMANPHIRFVVACGTDSRQAIGHLPGQSLVALSEHGLDDRMRIIKASGKRPVVRNLTREAVEYFRRTIGVVDLVGTVDPEPIMRTIRRCAAENPGLAEPFAGESVVAPTRGHLPSRMVPDPAGYFVVFVDRQRKLLSLEHYRNDGVLDAVIEGQTAAELYTPAIEQAFMSRLDHAAYLGRELARAEHSLLVGEPYVQDAAAGSDADSSAKGKGD